MMGWGFTFLVLGIGSIILPHFDVQFVLMSFMDNAQPFAGIGIAVLGAIMMAVGRSSQ